MSRRVANSARTRTSGFATSLRRRPPTLLRNRRVPAALDTLSRAAGLAPRDPDIHLALADLLQQQGAAGKAGLEYEACLRLRRNWLPASRFRHGRYVVTMTARDKSGLTSLPARRTFFR